MRFKNFSFIILVLVFLFFFLPSEIFAQEREPLPVITIINPIRGSEWHGKTDLLASLRGQWAAMQEQKVNATWLWQYTALEDDHLVNFAKDTMKDQEFGLFLEIDRNTAQKAHVQYRGQGALYQSDGLLLVSYDKDERKRFIDEIFHKFKEKFGYYPKTVGAWWIGGDSLVYMQKRYGIVAAMKAADQFDLDAYSIWGSPWSVPYLASKENESIPASSFDNSSKVVILQWAPRDPLNGYADAMFSLQDFALQGYPFSYVDYLSAIYLRKPLDNINVGLENGGTFKQFESYFQDKLTGARRSKKENKVNIFLVKDYAEDFLKQRKIFASADVNYFLAKDYKSDDQSFWYNSTNFRAGIHKRGGEIYLIDLRDYAHKIDEDFSVLPNSQGKLRVSTPSIIDSIRFSDQKLLIAKSKDAMRIEDKGDVVTLFSGNKKLAHFTKTSVDIVTDKGKAKTFIFGGKQEQALLNDRTFFFDKKEILLLSLLPFPSFLSIPQTLFFFKFLPFLILLVAYFIFRTKSLSVWRKPFFYSVLAFVVLLYVHVPYFPLDRSTYKTVAIVFTVIALTSFAISIVVFKIIKSKKVLFASLIGVSVALGILGGVVLVSRTKLSLIPFEMDALKVIKDRHKDVLLISETDYNIRPIYKAIKPVLYENYHLGEKLTGTHWQVVTRPENNVIKLWDYRNKLVLAPRYLGADFSEHEMNIHKFKKIFDNGQIALFEKK